MIEVIQIYGGDYNKDGNKWQHCIYEKDSQKFMMTFVSDYRKDACNIHVSELSEFGSPSYMFECKKIDNAELIVTKELIIDILNKNKRALK